MKKLLILFFSLSFSLHAQYSVKGTLNPVKKYSWVLLYKVEGTKQVFIKNTQIETEGNTGVFKFNLPKDTKIGSYRITYDLKNNGVIDFLFNKEDVEIELDPSNPNATTVFKESTENILYSKFLNETSFVQNNIDSLQGSYFKNKANNTKEAYRNWVDKLQKIEQQYLVRSQGMLVYHFIKASDRFNASEIAKLPEEYLSDSIDHFFDQIDFSNNILYNSSFLIDKISDFIFYLHYSENSDTQEELYKKAAGIVLKKIKNSSFRAAVIEFLITQFSEFKNTPTVDYLFNNHFNKLPQKDQNNVFKKKILEKMSVNIGRVAPDFSWTENGKEFQLSSLNHELSYLIIFYSTECSHCLREIPEIHEYMKDKTNTKVIAFAMENSDKTWINYQLKMPRWHHVLGLGKWENPTARTYQINSTPTYFVLGIDKQIISIPETIDDLKLVLRELN
jgi:thiol-disulfide isomerase/thioredoxin